MLDPTRIPAVIAELQRTWEGQPDLTLPALWARLEARGIARNSTDGELMDAVTSVQRQHPSAFEGPATEITARVLIDTEGPQRVLTVDPWHVAVHGWIPSRLRSAPAKPSQRRAAVASPRQPVVWPYSEIIRCRPGEVLVIADASGTRHRLGVVKLITLLQDGLNHRHPQEPQSLSGTRRNQYPEREWLLRFASGSTVSVGYRMGVADVSNREVAFSSLPWERLDKCEVGDDVAARGPDGTPVSALDGLGPLESITVLR